MAADVNHLAVHAILPWKLDAGVCCEFEDEADYEAKPRRYREQ